MRQSTRGEAEPSSGMNPAVPIPSGGDDRAYRRPLQWLRRPSERTAAVYRSFEGALVAAAASPSLKTPWSPRPPAPGWHQHVQ